MSTHIISIDPGLTTGYCTAKLFDNREFEITDVAELEWNDRFRLNDLIGDSSIVVIEDFRLYKHAAQNQINSFFPSVLVIGMVEAFCWLQGHYEMVPEGQEGHDEWISKPIVKQMAAVMQNVSVLPKDQHWIASSEHRGDAIKHLRYYALTKGRK